MSLRGLLTEALAAETDRRQARGKILGRLAKKLVEQGHAGPVFPLPGAPNLKRAPRVRMIRLAMGVRGNEAWRRITKARLERWEVQIDKATKGQIGPDDIRSSAYRVGGAEAWADVLGLMVSELNHLLSGLTRASGHVIEVSAHMRFVQDGDSVYLSCRVNDLDGIDGIPFYQGIFRSWPEVWGAVAWWAMLQFVAGSVETVEDARSEHEPTS